MRFPSLHADVPRFIVCYERRQEGMHMQEIFGNASFRSRQQVMRFDAALRRAGVRGQVISTPRDVSVGCGLSVRFDPQDTAKVLTVYNQTRPSNLIGFYQVERQGSGRPRIIPLL